LKLIREKHSQRVKFKCSYTQRRLINTWICKQTTKKMLIKKKLKRPVTLIADHLNLMSLRKKVTVETAHQT